jgi:hypothetical protein
MRADEFIRQLENDPEYQVRTVQREAHERAFRAAAEPLLRDLEAAGINTRDFGRFVNRPVPGVLEPSVFDEQAATPILVSWLPRMTDPRVKETIVRHLKNPAAKGVAVDVLVSEFRAETSTDDYRWVIGDVLSYVATREDLPTVVALAMDVRYGIGRQPLVEQFWRVKTPDVERFLKNAIADPTVARTAGTALRRIVGNDDAKRLLLEHADAKDKLVASAAQEHLKRIARARKKRM